MAQTVQPVHSDLLERVREEPYAIIGQASLACLQSFLGGYESGSARIGKTSDLDPRLEHFSEWVMEKLGGQSLSVSGIDMIQLESEDESRALDRYFELWDEYTTQVETEVLDSASRPILPASGFHDLLTSIQRRPAMYLSQVSVTLLRAFFQGYVAALQGSARSMPDVPDFERFSRWLCARYHMREGYRWDRLLLFFHRSEAEAFEKFFTLFSEYETGTVPDCR